MAKRGRRPNKKNNTAASKRIILVCGISFAVVLIAFLFAYFSMRKAVNQYADDVIWNNIYVEELSISGMTAEEAKIAVETLSEEYKECKIKLVVDKEEKAISLSELGFRVKNADELVSKAMAYGKAGSLLSRYRQLKNLEETATVFEVLYEVDAKVLKDVIVDNFSDLEGAAVDATIKRENGQFVVTDSKAGLKVDFDASIRLIEEHFDADWEYAGVETIELVTTIDEPDITKEQLSQIKDVLGTCTTSFVSTNNRGKNVMHATSRINGIVLMPGDEISASDTMGSRNAENGYLTAGSYLNGETVETYGGGVCQVSSTLYAAVLAAELEITERHPHSMTVSYLLDSMDAAISEGWKDLKFKNNTQYPIYIEGYTVGGLLTFTIYGKETRPANRAISFEAEVLSESDPGYKFVATADAVGVMKISTSKHNGMKAKLWKIVKENGVEVSREQINASTYSASKGTYHVGTATDNAEAKAIITKAIATQNEAEIRAAIAKAQAVINASKKPAVETQKPEETTPTPENGTGEN